MSSTGRVAGFHLIKQVLEGQAGDPGKKRSFILTAASLAATRQTTCPSGVNYWTPDRHRTRGC
jgi:hypothetical protein